MLEALRDQAWSVVHVSGRALWTKSRFADGRYDLLLLDRQLGRVWTEAQSNVEQCFRRFNPTLTTAASDVLQRLQRALLDAKPDQLALELRDGEATLRVTQKQGLITFAWRFECRALPDGVAALHALLVEPLMVCVAELSQRYVDLYELTMRKDRELHQYRRLHKKVDQSFRTEPLSAATPVEYMRESYDMEPDALAQLQRYAAQPDASALSPLMQTVLAGLALSTATRAGSPHGHDEPSASLHSHGGESQATPSEAAASAGKRGREAVAGTLGLGFAIPDAVMQPAASSSASAAAAAAAAAAATANKKPKKKVKRKDAFK